MKLLSFLIVCLVIISCAPKQNEIITLDLQKDLIPECIAIDAENQTIFLNSLNLAKIVKCKIDGSDPKVVVDSHQFGSLPGFGMLIKGDTLFALGNSLPTIHSKSVLLLLNKNTGQFIKSYSPIDTTFRYLNDLTISSDNKVYITDSESSKLYIITPQVDSLQIYLDSDEIWKSNGITISDNGKYLYVAARKNGIRVIDRETKQIANERHPDSDGIDGLKFYHNTLIGMREDGVYQYLLNEAGNKIESGKVILSFDEQFHSPTTFTIVGDMMYFTMNSQLDNFNDEAGFVIDSVKLEKYRVMKVDLAKI